MAPSHAQFKEFHHLTARDFGRMQDAPLDSFAQGTMPIFMDLNSWR